MRTMTFTMASKSKQVPEGTVTIQVTLITTYETHAGFMSHSSSCGWTK
jgi:hypothetical protein